MKTVHLFRRVKTCGATLLLATVVLTGCGPSIGAMKTGAASEVSQMSGLSQPMKDEATWRIDSANEKETVERYLEQVRAENVRILAEAASRNAAIESWVGSALTVAQVRGNVDVSVGEAMTLEAGGAVHATPGLAELTGVTSWERVDQFMEDVRLCTWEGDCSWHLRLLPKDSEFDVALERGVSGTGPSFYLDVGEQ